MKEPTIEVLVDSTHQGLQRGSAWERVGASGSEWERVGASGSEWERVGASGSAWERVGASRSEWERVGASGSAWERVGARVFEVVGIVRTALACDVKCHLPHTNTLVGR